MRGRFGLLGMFAVFVLLVLVAIFQGRENDDNTPSNTPEANTTPSGQTVEGQPVFNGWDYEDVGAVRMRDPRTGATFAISRDNSGTWWIPGDTREINQQVADEIANAAALLPYHQQLDVPPERYDEFGLDENTLSLVVEVLLVNGESYGFIVGNTTPGREAYYLMADHSDTIYVSYRDDSPVDFLIAYLYDFWQNADKLDNEQNPR